MKRPSWIANLYFREDNKWKPLQAGRIIELPKKGSCIFVIGNGTAEYKFTGLVEHTISVEFASPNTIEIIVQDTIEIYKLLLPAHLHDISELRKRMKGEIDVSIRA